MTEFPGIRHAEPGTIFVLEFAGSIPGESDAHTIDASERLIRSVFDEANLPVVICLGDQIPAQTVVDWLQLGVYTYLERSAGASRFQQVFAEAGCRSALMVRQFERFETLRNRWNSVSDREATVLELLLEGIPNKTIANRLGVSQRTVETRRHNLYEKLESRSVAEVVRVIYELGGLERMFRRRHEGVGNAVSRPHFAVSRPLPLLNPNTFDIAVGD